MSPLELAIIKTLTWFDLFKCPLTSWEVWHYLWDETGGLEPMTPLAVILMLEKMSSRGKVVCHSGYWQLADQESDFWSERGRRIRWSINKRRRACRAARVLAHLPHVRFIGLVNTLAFDAASQDSDIDFFVITDAGRIFTARFLVTAVVQALGWRRHHYYINNRICLSFYLSADNLNLQPLAYIDDPYLRFWLLSLNPLYDDGIYQEFIKANSWLNSEFPARRQVVDFSKIKVKAKAGAVLSSAAPEDNFLEKVLRDWQICLIGRHKNSRLGDGTTAVVVNKKILKFHEQDTRLELARQFRQRLAQVIS